VTGFVVNSVEEAAQAVGRVASLSRHTCRCVFEERFNAARMAQDYVEVYRRLVYAGSELVDLCLIPLSRCRSWRDTTVSGKLSRSYVPLLGALPDVK